MLAPSALQTADLKIALKPTAGYEQQLYASTDSYTNPGDFLVTGLNSGTLNKPTADTTQLLAKPQELIAVLDGPVNSVQNIVLTVVGLDQFGAAFNGTATFAPPSYVQNQEQEYPKCWGVDVLPVTAGQKCASITSVSVACLAIIAPVTVKLFGVPSFANVSNQPIPPAQAGSYKLISAKTKIDWDPRVPMPHSVQVGRNLSKFVKQGEIPEGKLSITQKIGSVGDGLMRINGVAVTGLIREVKEDRVETMRTYLLGLTVQAKVSTGQSVEDAEATGEGLYEESAIMVAG